MLTGRGTPNAWRQGFQLFRRRAGVNAYGDTVYTYDLSSPDFTAEDGSEGGLCFQSVQTWQSSGRTSGEAALLEPGEEPGGAAQAVVYGDLTVQPFDRILLKSGLFEVKGVQEWLSYRLLLLDRIASEAG